MVKIVGIKKTPAKKGEPYYEFTIFTNFGQKIINIFHTLGLEALQEIETYLINLTPCGEWDKKKPIGSELYSNYQYFPHEVITRYKIKYHHMNGGISICEPIYETTD